MSIAADLLFLHGYVATPGALAGLAATPPVAPSSDPEPVVEVLAPEAGAPATARSPWRPGPLYLIEALCGTTLPAQFRIA